MSKQNFDNRLVAIILAMIAFILSLMGTASLDYVLPASLQIVGSGAVGVLVYSILIWAMRQNKDSQHTSRFFGKLISILILMALYVSTVTATQSLWIYPFSTTISRFAYENIATGAGFTAIFLIFLLTAWQKDVYWVTRKKSIKFDERELQVRQRVFERSYKISAFLVLAATWFFATKIHNIPSIIAYNIGSVPGHLYWLPFNLAQLIFALPLIIAAWQKDS